MRIITNKTKVPKTEFVLNSYIISKYVTPHLINGYKYDMRILVLVTSFNPLKVYIYNDWIVRFCTDKYSTDTKNLDNIKAHICCQAYKADG